MQGERITCIPCDTMYTIYCAGLYLNVGTELIWFPFPLLCCLCAEAPLWAWCGMGICLWAILITSRNGKCLMCSGEVIDIDLCCGGLWRGSIIAGSRQSQLCIIRLGCVCLLVCVWILCDFWQWSSMETSHIIRESWQRPPSSYSLV